MASHSEPMDVDSEFDNKENSYRHSNVLPSTEKGYEELDVSELNMKLRYSITPANSPMSKSYTANCVDNRFIDPISNPLNINSNDNANLTRSLNANINKNDSVVKSLKALPLQSLSTDVADSRSTTVLRPLDKTDTENGNHTIIISGPDDIDENLSLPSTSSSTIPTPEATTPTKEIPKNEEGSPIMRGLKTVLNMFRSSQSPIPPGESDGMVKSELSPEVSEKPENCNTVTASTPISAHHKKEVSPCKKSSPLKESLVFNDDLEKELLWKDETTIIFSQERIPIHKLFFQNSVPNNAKLTISNAAQKNDKDLDSTVEYMDISYNDSILQDKTMCEAQADVNRNETTLAAESDSEFVDCETTFTKDDFQIVDDKITPVTDQTEDVNKNDSRKENSSKLKQIILNTTQDILDATLSITPNDLNDSFNKTTHINEYQYTKLANDSNELVTAPLDVTTLEPTPLITEQIVVNIVDDHLLTKPNINENNSTIQHTNAALLKNSTLGKLDSYSELNLMKLDHVMGPMPDDQDLTRTLESKVIRNHTLEFDRNPPVSDPEENNSNNTVVMENVDNTLENEVVSRHSLDHDANVSVFNHVEETDFNNTIVIDDFNKEACDLNKTRESEVVEKQALGFGAMVLVSDSAADNTVVLESTFEKKTPAEDLVKTPDSVPISTNMINISQDVKSNENLQQINSNHGSADTPFNCSEIIEENTQNILNPRKEFLIDEDKNKTTLDEHVCTQMKIEDISNLEKNNSITEHEFAIEQCEFNTATQESCRETESKIVLDNKHVRLTIKKELGSDNIALPSDIPLPEDDDIEKELIAASLPLDLGDNLQLVYSDNLEDVVPNVCEKNNFQNGSSSSQDMRIVADTEVQNPTDDLIVKQEIHSTENSDTKSELAFDTTSSTNVAINDIVLNIKDSENHLSNMCKETQECNEPQILQKLVNKLKMEEPTQSLAHKEVAMAINNSVAHLKSLPDVINQTIIPSQDDSQHTKISLEINDESTEFKSLCENTNLEMTVDQSTEKEPYTINDTLPTCVDSEKCDVNIVDKTIDLNKTQLIEKTLDTTRHVCDDSMSNGQASEAIDKDKKLSDIICEEVASENNSPFLYVTVEDIVAAEKCVEDDKFSSDLGEVVSTAQPVSPPISSKGYNFNFDEMDDPFFTKTKISLSAIPNTTDNIDDHNKDKTEDSKKHVPKKLEAKMENKKEVQNRRKSQPERKQPFLPKKKFNSTFDCTAEERFTEKSDSKISHPSDTICESRSDSTIEVSDSNMLTNLDECKINDAIEYNSNSDKLNKTNLNDDKSITPKNKINDSVLETDSINDNAESSNQIPFGDSTITFKDSSSTKQSEYPTPTPSTSSSENIKSRNVFNIPEIDDMNFNPFATKTKIRQSPTPKEDDNPFITLNKLKSSPETSLIQSDNKSDSPQNVNEKKLNESGDKTETELMEKDSSTNLSNTTSSSKTTDERDETFREINTEDEDTVEGPFLELDDLNNDDKNMHYEDDIVDMMQFHEIPKIKKENQESDEMFIDAEAFEFLLNQNKSNTVADSGKESLFLKFDPLFAKRLSCDGVLTALNKLQRSQSTPTKMSKTITKDVTSPIAGPSHMNATTDIDMNTSEDDELNITVSKPMMVVPPAVNPAVTPRNRTITPNRSNRRSITFTSPAMAVIDRLLSLSGNNSSVPDSPINQVSRQQNEADLALTQLRELLAEKEVHVYTLRSESKELKDRLSTLENQVKELETESQGRLKKINDLNGKLLEKTKINKSMAAVVEEYERTIASLIAETEQDKKRHAEERMKLISERDEQTAHLTSMEVSFSDLHSKYEKSKQVIFNCKANEDKYKKSIKEFEENLTKMQNNYELLKQHATSKLNHANQELEKINKAHEAEMLKLNAMIKRKELHITSLEESLAQKTKANEELTAICDELINKVG